MNSSTIALTTVACLNPNRAFVSVLLGLASIEISIYAFYNHWPITGCHGTVAALFGMLGVFLAVMPDYGIPPAHYDFLDGSKTAGFALAGLILSSIGMLLPWCEIGYGHDEPEVQPNV